MIESAEKTIKWKSKVKNLWKKYCSSKEISSDYDYPFNFKNTNWYSTIVYLVTFIMIPIMYSLIKTYIFHVTPVNGQFPSSWQKKDLLAQFLVPIIGMAIVFAVDWQAMVKRGAWAAYTHFIFGIASAVFVFLFLINTKIISGKSTDNFSVTVIFLSQMIIQFIGSLIVIFTNKSLRKQIIATIKETKMDLLIWILIFLALFSLLNMVFNKIASGVNSNLINNDSNSSNQDHLLKMASTPFGFFALIIGSIFLAPINEEISYRYGTFSIVRHKWLGFTASLIYFPAMHVMENGDWNKIIGYLAMGLTAPVLFVCTRGNIVYTIGLHILINTLATVAIWLS